MGKKKKDQVRDEKKCTDDGDTPQQSKQTTTTTTTTVITTKQQQQSNNSKQQVLSPSSTGSYQQQQYTEHTSPSPGGVRARLQREAALRAQRRQEGKTGAGDENDDNIAKNRGMFSFSCVCNWVCGVCVFVLLLWLKSAQEAYNVGGSIRRQEVDHYEVLDVPRGASQSVIRQAYRKLSLRWHPDKNRDCVPCQDKFMKIASAYEVLHDETKRKVYDDSAGGEFDSLQSDTVYLDERNFDHLVTDGDDIWVIQVFSETDSRCRSFAPYWEEVASQLHEVAKFGRIDALRQKEVLKKLPVKAAELPLVILIAKGQQPSVFSSAMGVSVATLKNFVAESLPSPVSSLSCDEVPIKLNKLSSKKDVIIILSPSDTPSLITQSIAYQWKYITNIIFIKYNYSSICSDALLNLPLPNDSDTHKLIKNGAIMYCSNMNVYKHTHKHTLNDTEINTDNDNRACVRTSELLSVDPKDGETFKSKLFSLQIRITPWLHQWNFKKLCHSNSLYRIYCLIMIESEAPSIFPLVDALNVAREEYSQTVKQDEEAFEIQPARVSFVPGAWFSPLDAPPSYRMRGLYTLWENNGRPNALLIDAEGKRFIGLHLNQDVVSNIYFSISDEMLHFKDLEEVCIEFSHCLYDIEVGVFGEILLKLYQTKWDVLHCAAVVIVLGVLYWLLRYKWGVVVVVCLSPVLLLLLSWSFWNSVFIWLQ
eukprot:GHVR01142554.1.p1 GENE.GHVR01142554.1~~GHVR01142554.1.p1  ORF type:complete len:704 (+),score=167.55 GHVR01142554.1:52-2163(+)